MRGRVIVIGLLRVVYYGRVIQSAFYIILKRGFFNEYAVR